MNTKRFEELVDARPGFCGVIPSDSLLNEKITDMINYALLLEALIQERKEAEKDE